MSGLSNWMDDDTLDWDKKKKRGGGGGVGSQTC